MGIITVDGWLAGDPELKYLPSGQPALEFRLPDNHKRKVGSEWVEESTTWWKIKAFGSEAERLANSGLVKGTRVEVHGRSKTETWTGRDGQERSELVILDPMVRIIPPKNTPDSGHQERQGVWAAPGHPEPVQQSWGGPDAEPPF